MTCGGTDHILYKKANLDKKFQNCILVYPGPETNYYFEKIDDSEEGTFLHSIDLSRINDISYLNQWVLDITDQFLNFNDQIFNRD